MVGLDKVVGCIIMEQTSTDHTCDDLKIIRHGDVYYAKFRACLQSLDVFNRNGRNYSTSAITAGLQNENVLELLREGTWLGENGHPDSENMKRIVTINPQTVCHRILNPEVRGNMVYADIETLNDDLYGKQFTKHLEQGIEPAFSLRALAKIQTIGGKAYVNSKPYIVTYDRVIFPSHKEAYRDKNVPVKFVNESAGPVLIPTTESSDYTVNKVINIVEQQVIDYVTTESANVRNIVEVFECNCDHVGLSHDNKTIIIKNGNETFHIAIEDYIVNELRNYMADVF